MVEKNQIIKLEITAISNEGSGVARFEGMAIFVPMTAIGDIINAKVVKVLKSYAYAIIEEIITPSENRIENDCPVYARCGGCSLRHINYNAEIEVKTSWLKENLLRIGNIKPDYDESIPSPLDARYRNKAQYPVRQINGKMEVGFFASRSHELIPIRDCRLQPDFFANIANVILEFCQQFSIAAYNETENSGILRHIYIRHGEITNQTMVCLVINADFLPHSDELRALLRRTCPSLTTIVLSHNKKRTNVITGTKQTVLYGSGAIEDEICGIKVQISPLSFYQVNRQAAELIYKAALEYAKPEPTDILLDLYCGAGSIGLSMASSVAQVIGVEIIADAVDDAKRTAKSCNIKNARFIKADAAKAAIQLKAEGTKPNIVVLDPPRKGADEALLETIANMNPQKIVYISCNSATLARDCAILAKLGYKTTKARAADLFPRTAHVEAVALLVREQE